jgi:hypothetical protein
MKKSGNLLLFALIGLSAAALFFYWKHARPPTPNASTHRVESALQPMPGAETAVTFVAQTSLSSERVNELPPDSFARTKAIVRIKMQQWAERKTGDEATESRLLNELLALLTDGNAAELTLSFSAEGQGTPFGLAALQRWLSVDPAKAARWIAAHANAIEPQALLVARELLKNPAGLREYCNELPDGDWKQGVLKSASLEISANDPTEAINLARQMKADSVQLDVLHTVVYDWLTRDPITALDWITKVSDPALREGLLATGSKAIAATDPELAAEWLATSLKSEKIQTDTALSVVEVWATQDPAKAAKWVSLFPAQGLREAAANIVADRWFKSDPNAATAWLLTLPERSVILARLESERIERQRPPDPN